MSSICPRFTQNAWKKDLCSNCFKSKDEHKIPLPVIPINNNKTDLLQKFSNTTTSTTTIINNDPPPKGIIKNYLNKSKKRQSVSFPKELIKIIGYGGEWSDTEFSEDEEITPLNGNDDITSTDDEEHQELMRLTKLNTDFNTNNGNLLGDPEENIKKSFAALRLGTPQMDSSGKKQTLKISVTPFGTTSKASSIKKKFEINKDDKGKIINKDEQQQITNINNNVDDNISNKGTKKSDEGNISPPIERAMEKSLLEEISETLEKKQQNEAIKKIQPDKDGKIKFEITSLSPSRLSPESKKSSVISRNSSIAKDQIIPSNNKISIFSKCSDSESNTSDVENGISAYYDVIETSSNGYENIPDGHDRSKDQTDNCISNNNSNNNDNESNSNVSSIEDKQKNKLIYSSSQYITDILLSAKTHSASYSLREGSFMTSKITSDGLIVTKCSSDDALDSTGSSFDGSSDEETSYNMNRSESDSGIGISIGSDYQSIPNDKDSKDKKINSNININNSDYEDIQVIYL